MGRGRAAGSLSTGKYVSAGGGNRGYRIKEFLSVQNEDYQKLLETRVKDILGPGKTLGHLAEAGGIPKDATLNFRAYRFEPDRINVTGTGPKNAAGDPEYYMERTFSRTASGDLIIHNDYFRLQETGTGRGTQMFYNQVKAAQKLGAVRIDTLAAKGMSYNGYKTWPRLGYDARLSQDDIARIDRTAPDLKGATKVSDLMKTPEGREWWTEMGHSADMSFDLRPGSNSMNVLESYVNSKKK